MTRTVLALLALTATSAAAQGSFPPQIMYGRPLPSRNPPTLPLHQPVIPPMQTVRPQQRHTTYIPAPIPYYYYGSQPYSAPQQSVEVNVTNVIETPPQQISYGVFSPPGAGQYLISGLRMWDAEADLAAERAASVTHLDPDRLHSTEFVDTNDVRSVESIVNAMYDVLSGPRGTSRNWVRFRTLFADGARLIATRSEGNAPARAIAMSTEEYVSTAGPMLERGVFQREVAHSVERFGTIAHVFSTFECRRTSSDLKPYQRGINSIQLMNDGTRWWITSVSWDAERPDNPIPAKYLNQK